MNTVSRRLQQWVRQHPALIDVALCTGFLAIYAAEARPLLLNTSPLFGPYVPPDALALGISLLVIAPLLLRRRAPLAAAVLSLGSAFVWRLLDYPPFAAIDLVTLVMAYSWGQHASSPRPILAVGVLALWAAAGQLVSPVPFEPLDFAVLTSVFVGAWVLGRSMRTQQAQARVLAAQFAERAVAAERARFARELHDVVAHHVSVVVVQAAGARASFDDDPASARAALHHIENSGRDALIELRHLLGALREPGDSTSNGAAARAPQPTVAELEELVSRMEASGLRVDMTREGREVAVPASVGLAAYRIIQEALTNTLRHAPGACASITLRYEPEAIEIEVTDDGSRAHDAQEPPGGGNGHEGIRQRVALLGGTVDIGPRPAAGYRVWARLPLSSPLT